MAHKNKIAQERLPREIKWSLLKQFHKLGYNTEIQSAIWRFIL